MRLPLILLSLALASCRQEQEPPAPTADQASQLNEMDYALNGLAANNEEGPADRSASPSNHSK